MNYVAIVEDGNITYYGEGNTPEEAVQNFIDSGEFLDYCHNEDFIPEDIDISVWTTSHITDYDWDEFSTEEGWTWMTKNFIGEWKYVEGKGVMLDE